MIIDSLSRAFGTIFQTAAASNAERTRSDYFYFLLVKCETGTHIHNQEILSACLHVVVLYLKY